MNSFEHTSRSETSFSVAIPAISDCFTKILEFVVLVPWRIRVSVVFFLEFWAKIVVNDVVLEVLKRWLVIGEKMARKKNDEWNEFTVPECRAHFHMATSIEQVHEASPGSGKGIPT